MKKNAIKLGLMPPLTGLVSIYGEEISRAGHIACAEVNESGGVQGRPLELVIEDDGSLPESAVAAAEKLVNQHRCTALIGNLLSNSRIAVAYRVAEPHRIPYLNFSFYEGSILSSYFFHFAALPNQQIDRMIPYMRHQFGTRMFFAGNNYEWPRGSIHAAKLALERAGGEVVGEEYCPIGVDADTIECLLDHVEAAMPDVFVPFFAGIDQTHLLTRFTQRGMKQRIAVVMGHYDEMMASTLPAEVRAGFYSSNTYFMSMDTTENRDYLARLARFRGVDGIWPKGNGILTNFGEGAYICVKAFAQAANLAGSLHSEALAAALKTVNIAAPQGRVQMNPKHHHARVNTCLTRCEADGTFTIIEKFGAIEPVLPERYKHQQVSQRATLEDDIRLQARILEQMSEGILLISTQDGNILYTNANAESAFGYDKGEMIGLNIARFSDSCPSDPAATTAAVIQILRQKGEWQGETRNVKKDGSPFWCYATISTFTHPTHGEVWLSVQRDVTKRKQAEEALTLSETKLRTLYESTSDAVMLLDERGFLDCNKAALEMFGCTSREELCSKHPAHLSPPQQPCGAESMVMANQKMAAALENGRNFFEWVHKRLDTGQDFFANVLLNRMELNGKSVLQATVRDITERKRAEEDINRLAFYDPLTGLPNRRLLQDRLQQAIAASTRSSRHGALLFLDMDNFKAVNDAQGHAVGDLLLAEVARRLQGCVREGDSVARLGGDEFVVVLEELSNEPHEAATQTELVAEKIRSDLNRPYRLEACECHISPSIGVSMFLGHLESAENLLKHADTAMYQSKAAGRNAIRFFDQRMQAALDARIALEADLRQAVVKKQFRLHYQMQIDGHGRVVGAEVLLRWQHSDHGLVFPNQFIPLAEETGLILPIGLWVLESACAQLQEWQRDTLTCGLTLAVNVSARQFHQVDFVAQVRRALLESGANPFQLKLELTESTVLDNIDDTIAKMCEIKQLGVSFLLDDFGTGHSSLSYLKRLPLDQIKIDQSFVLDISCDPNTAAIVQAIIVMTGALGLSVIAEGVETEMQHYFLSQHGCHHFQGYLFGKPMPIEQFETLLAERRHWSLVQGAEQGGGEV